jgi:antirestriction protein ArdC
MTFKQAKKAGGKIRKGAIGQPVYYFNFLYFQYVNDEKVKISKTKFDELKAIDKNRDDIFIMPFLRYYRVFNAVDIEGIDFPEEKKIKKSDKEQIASCEFIVDSYKDKPDIGDSANGRAYYSPSADHVRVPAMQFFEKEQNYYSTLFHELGHSTGHKKRLDRDMTGNFGSKSYAFEELIAEFTALFLSADAGIAYYTMENSAAYIQSWNKSVKEILKENNKAIFQASAAAQKARDHIMGGNSLDEFNPEKYRPKRKTKDKKLDKKLKLAELEAKAKLKLLKMQKV